MHGAAQVDGRAARLTALDDVLLAHILEFLAARDLEAVTVAAKVVATHVVPRFPDLWRSLFCRRWATLNFPLRGVESGEATLAVDRRLRELFSKDCSESRMYQILAHAIVPVPSYADLDQTRRSEGYSDAKHAIQSLHAAGTRPSHVVSFAFNGDVLGDDRSVRANAPFPAAYHLAVFKRASTFATPKPQFQIGLVASGYFEIRITQRDTPARIQPAPDTDNSEDVAEEAQHEAQPQPEEEELTSLGLVQPNFPLVGRQPGWNQRSFGYHGDDGRLYRQTSRGQFFGPRFGVNDTVGCGVRRDLHTARSRVFFTSNGNLVARPGEQETTECPHASWYPAVGVDSYNAVCVNFGQEPFAHDEIVDELFAECDPNQVDLEVDLPWHAIREYSIGCSVWRRRQARQARASALADADKKRMEMAETTQNEEQCMSKWLGRILTRRQQNRLASNEENASEERAAAQRRLA